MAELEKSPFENLIASRRAGLRLTTNCSSSSVRAALFCSFSLLLLSSSGGNGKTS
jgi:hypothetical protein